MFAISNFEKVIKWGKENEVFNDFRQNWKLVLPASSLAGISFYLLMKNKKSAKKAVDPYGDHTIKKNKKTSLVNLIFLRKLLALVKITVPGINSSETKLLITYSLFLLARTYLSIRISDINGNVVKSIVSLDRAKFLSSIGTLALFTIPASVVNSMLKFLLAKIAFSFRSQLLRYFNSLYFRPKIAYKVVNLDSRISNPEQVMVATVVEWSEKLATLYSNLSKPFLDIVLFSRRLSQLLGYEGPLAAFLYYFLTAVAYRIASPMFGKLTARALNLEGEFKRLHGRLINYAEEVALYRGNQKERQILDASFERIASHSCYTINKEFLNALFQGFISKYGAFLTAYGVLGLPVFGSKAKSLDVSKEDRSGLVGDYIRNSNLYINLSVAIGKIIVSYNDLQKLAGYTQQLYDFRSVLLDLSENRFTRAGFDKLSASKKVFAEAKDEDEPSRPELRFKDVSIVTPNGDVLVEKMSFVINPGMDVLITGPNGCGKSSLFRILSGLWPVAKGKVRRSKESALFYIPQKPYLPKGTLRDQIIYPQSESECNKISSNSKVEKCLNLVNMSYINKKESGGLDEVKDWGEVLSGGEKQQIALARLIYHKPVYAILDECTSAVSFDLEKQIYTYCHVIGITLITVSHRKSLWKYHRHLLEFDGAGGWNFRAMRPEDLKD